MLWHFTCGHAAERIGHRGVLVPVAHPLAPALGPVVWLTSDPRPEPDDIGLGSNTLLTCDRMAYRYRCVHGTVALPWAVVRRHVAPMHLADLETYGRPETWHVATEPVKVRLA